MKLFCYGVVDALRDAAHGFLNPYQNPLLSILICILQTTNIYIGMYT